VKPFLIATFIDEVGFQVKEILDILHERYVADPRVYHIRLSFACVTSAAFNALASLLLINSRQCL
jgi:hypothetical protein